MARAFLMAVRGDSTGDNTTGKKCRLACADRGDGARWVLVTESCSWESRHQCVRCELVLEDGYCRFHDT
jgi:hypothetical protein